MDMSLLELQEEVSHLPLYYTEDLRKIKFMIRIPGGFLLCDDTPKDDEEAFKEFKIDTRPFLDDYPLFTIEYIREGISQSTRSSKQIILRVKIDWVSSDTGQATLANNEVEIVELETRKLTVCEEQAKGRAIKRSASELQPVHLRQG